MQETISRSMGTEKEPHWLADYRKKNAELAEKIPAKKSKYTQNEKLWEKAEQLKQAKGKIIFSADSGKIKIMEWEQALKEHSETVKKALEKESMPPDKLQAAANAFFTTGIVIIVPEGTETKELFQIRLSADNGCIAKNLVVLGENSNAMFLEKINPEKDILLSETIVAGQNANAIFCRIFNGKETGMLAQENIAGKDATIANANAWLACREVKAEISNTLQSQGARIQQLDMLLGTGEQHYDILVNNQHMAQNTESYALFKSVLQGRAKSVYDGMIKILPTGQKASALLEAHSMLLGEKASSNNIPGLEIEADDVKATHSASVAQLEQEHLFYLQSKGIEENKAKKIVTSGFLEAVMIRLPEQFHEIISLELEKSMEQESE